MDRAFRLVLVFVLVGYFAASTAVLFGNYGAPILGAILGGFMLVASLIMAWEI